MEPAIVFPDKELRRWKQLDLLVDEERELAEKLINTQDKAEEKDLSDQLGVIIQKTRQILAED
ncbi:MAG TPA: hypothetical protein VKK79_16815 [Candidatus Lokiarchaeia archaeon]|nr:hypothetical protein [Candidatus Lokiarchaeia archaeon]